MSAPKISDIIAELQNMLAQYGDLDVVKCDTEYSPIERPSIVYLGSLKNDGVYREDGNIPCCLL